MSCGSNDCRKKVTGCGVLVRSLGPDPDCNGRSPVPQSGCGKAKNIDTGACGVGVIAEKLITSGNCSSADFAGLASDGCKAIQGRGNPAVELGHGNVVDFFSATYDSNGNLQGATPAGSTNCP
jgi:hypothetical protein